MAEEFSFEEIINQRFNSDPIEPFAITLTSGERFEIDDRIQMLMAKSTITLYHSRTGFTMFRKSQIVALHAS
jgi:hypothetical protein